MKDLAPAAWRRKIEKEIGEKIPDLVWGWITTSEERKHIKQANAYEAGAPDMGLSYLIEEVKYAIEGYKHNQLNLPQITSSNEKQEKPEKDEKDKSPREIKPDKRFRALSDIVAFLAGRDEDIKAFRLEALQGQLLQPEEVPAWINAPERGPHPRDFKNHRPGGKLVSKRNDKFKKRRKRREIRFKGSVASDIGPRMAEINNAGILGRKSLQKI